MTERHEKYGAELGEEFKCFNCQNNAEFTHNVDPRNDVIYNLVLSRGIFPSRSFFRPSEQLDTKYERRKTARQACARALPINHSSYPILCESAEDRDLETPPLESFP